MKSVTELVIATPMSQAILDRRAGQAAPRGSETDLPMRSVSNLEFNWALAQRK